MIGIYILASITALAAVYFAGYFIITKQNARINAEADKEPSTSTDEKLVNDQNGTTGRAFVYGLHRASFNACEVIAVHNVKLLCGIPSKLSDTALDFQKSLAMVLYGVFGSYVNMIGRVIKKYGLSYTRVKLSELTEDGIYIISFWNKNAPWNGLHTVAFVHSGGECTTYNLHGTGKCDKTPPSVYAEKYICGYRIAKGTLYGNKSIKHI